MSTTADVPTTTATNALTASMCALPRRNRSSTRNFEPSWNWDDPVFDRQNDPAAWPEQAQILAALFKSRTRAQWCALLEGSEACFAPVLDWNEAPVYEHNQARNAFIDVAGVTQPAPAPRFSATPSADPQPPGEPGADTEAVLREWGFEQDTIDDLNRAEAIGAAPR